MVINRAEQEWPESETVIVPQVKNASLDQLESWDLHLPHSSDCARRIVPSAECTCVRFEVAAELYTRQIER